MAVQMPSSFPGHSWKYYMGSLVYENIRYLGGSKKKLLNMVCVVSGLMVGGSNAM